MNRFFGTFLIVLAISLSSCEYQIFEVTSDIVPLRKDTYVFENDTVKITYNFWAPKGVMEFQVFNKLNAPIYIDWKNSFFILNSQRFVYWNDEIISSTQGMNTKGLYSYFNRRYEGYWSTSLTNSFKPERITSIPPKANYDRGNFIIAKNEMSFSNKKEKEKMFSGLESPLKFRSYLTISLTEALLKPIYLDHGFYVSKVFHAKEKRLNDYKDGRHFYLQAEPQE